MKKPSTLRSSAILLALLMLLSLTLSSCFFVSYPAPPPAQTVTAPPEPGEVTFQGTMPPGTVIAPEVDYEAIAKENLAALHKKDMNEASFFLLTTCASRFSPDISEEESLGRYIDTEIVKRNRMVEEHFNVRLLTIEEQEDVLLDMAWGAKWAGKYVADLVEIPSRLLGEFADQKLAYNLNSLPFTDFSAPYFNQDAIAQCSAGYYTYAVAGNANRYVDLALCVYYNESFFEGTDLYSAYEKGEWTWEMLFSLTGDHAVCLPDWVDIGEMMLASYDVHLLNTGYGVLPEAMEDKSGIEAAASAAARLMANCDTARGMEAFERGEIPFLLAQTRDYGALARAKFNWGILPLPKGSASQTRHTTLSSIQTLYVALPTMSSPDNTGLILQALNAATQGQVSAVIAEHALLTAAQNAKTCNILATLGRQMFYDFAMNISVGYESIENASVIPYAAAIRGEATFAQGYAEAEKNLKYWNPRNFVWD